MSCLYARGIPARYPSLADRVCLISEMSGGQEKVADPFREGPLAYEAMIQGLERLLDNGLAEIMLRVDGR